MTAHQLHNDNPDNPAEIVTFSGSVPPATGAVSAQIVDQGGRVLGSRTRSPNAPRVRVLAPAGGGVGRSGRAVSVRWAASDADGDALTALVEYSSDGGKSFRTVFYGPSTGSTRLPGRFFTRSSTARVRVTVNDGFNQTSALSARFVSLGGAPTVEIVQAPVAPVRDDVPAPLQAVGFDAAGRRLPGRALRWSVGKRSLGLGESIAASGLKPGRNRVTVMARDANGQTGRASVTIDVIAAKPVLLVLRAVKPRAGQRRVVLQIASSLPGTLDVQGRRYPVGRTTRRIVVRLRRGLKAGKAIAMTLRARGGSRTLAFTPLAAPAGG